MTDSKTRLSHSGTQTYISCGYKYKLHYLDKIRPYNVASYLFYGKKIEDGLDVLLLRKKNNRTPEEEALSKRDPKEVFDEGFITAEINGETIDPRFDERVKYFKKDVDEDILEDEDWDAEEEEGINLAWLSLRRKAHILIDAYEEEILPQIEEVVSIQEEVHLPDENGNWIVGYIDFIASFNDEPGVAYICDNKTASKAYKADSVSISEQLATYCEYKGTNKAAFIVLEKNIRKREPRARITIIRDEVPESTTEDVFHNYEVALDGIENKEYDKNYDGGCYSFGQPCPYFNYCRTNGDNMNGLVNLKENEDEQE